MKLIQDAKINSNFWDSSLITGNASIFWRWFGLDLGFLKVNPQWSPWHSHGLKNVLDDLGYPYGLETSEEPSIHKSQERLGHVAGATW